MCEAGNAEDIAKTPFPGHPLFAKVIINPAIFERKISWK